MGFKHQESFILYKVPQMLSCYVHVFLKLIITSTTKRARVCIYICYITLTLSLS